MNRWLNIMAWAHVVSGGAGLLLCAAFIGALAIARDAAFADEAAFFGPLLGGLAIFFFMPSFFSGIGLLKRRPWARAVIWVESAFLVFAIPVGTLVAGLNMWVLLSTREEIADGGIAKFEATMRSWARPVAAGLAALVILGVVVAIGFVFRDVIDPPRVQELTPMPGGAPPTVSRAPAG